LQELTFPLKTGEISFGGEIAEQSFYNNREPVPFAYASIDNSISAAINLV
jgi:hypothetical protein